MKLELLFTEVLSEETELDELHGVSFDARIWNPIILSYLKIGKSYISKGKKSPDMTIQGREYPQQYKVYPIDQIKMKIEERFGGGAAYDEINSGYDQNGQYVVYFMFGPYADQSSINHELRHSYEDYRRNSKGAKPLKQTKEATMLFGGDFEQLMTSGDHYSPFTDLIMGLYYTSKIERSAYSETVYDSKRNLFGSVINTIEHMIKNNTYANIMSRNPHPEILKSSWDTLKGKYRIPILDKFKDYDSFIKWACDEINYKGQKSLKKLRNVQYQSRLNQEKEKEGE